MTEKLVYELPKEENTVAEIVRAIPSNWSWVDGLLLAPKSLYEQGRIAKHTRLIISRFYSIRPTIIGRDDVPYELSVPGRAIDKEGVFRPAIADIILKKKLPSGVSFDEAAFETREITMGAVKELIEGFIKEGYKGTIMAYSGYRNNRKYDNPESFSLCHSDGKVELEWNEIHGGKRENLVGIVSTILRLGLKEIQPQEAPSLPQVQEPVLG